MRCMNCEADIPPQWVKAIQDNFCPGCGGEIMNETAKELLSELTEAMKKMPNNPEGIAGWLLSNYRFQKIGDAVPTEKFHDGSHKQQQQQYQDPGMPSLKTADNPVQRMLARTGYYKNVQNTQSKLTGNNKLAQMAQQIAGLEDDMYGGNAQAQEAPEQYFDEDDEVMVERGPRRSRELLTESNLVDSTAPALSPDEIQSLAEMTSNQDELESHQALQAQRMKRIRAQQGVASGMGNGVFRRSG